MTRERTLVRMSAIIKKVNTLPHCHFVIQADDPEHAEKLARLDVERDWQHFIDGPNCWSLESYHVLKRLGAPFKITCSARFDPDAVNFAHPVQINLLDARSDVFLVCLQADYPSCPWANLHIVVNQDTSDNRRRLYLPHWPLPCLIPRSPARSEVQRIGYTGHPKFLAGGFELWDRELRKAGFEFVRIARERCNDYSDIDIMLAVRSFDNKRWSNRPAWKLINAWHAQVPLIAGNDSAYSHIARPMLDYLRVTNLPDAIRWIELLRNNPTTYRELVKNGQRRATGYTQSEVAKAWIRCMESFVFPKYERWKRRGAAYHLSWTCALIYGRSVRWTRARAKAILNMARR